MLNLKDLTNLGKELVVYCVQNNEIIELEVLGKTSEKVMFLPKLEGAYRYDLYYENFKEDKNKYKIFLSLEDAKKYINNESVKFKESLKLISTEEMLDELISCYKTYLSDVYFYGKYSNFEIEIIKETLKERINND